MFIICGSLAAQSLSYGYFIYIPKYGCYRYMQKFLSSEFVDQVSIVIEDIEISVGVCYFSSNFSFIYPLYFCVSNCNAIWRGCSKNWAE